MKNRERPGNPRRTLLFYMNYSLTRLEKEQIKRGILNILFILN